MRCIISIYTLSLYLSYQLIKAWSSACYVWMLTPYRDCSLSRHRTLRRISRPGSPTQPWTTPRAYCQVHTPTVWTLTFLYLVVDHSDDVWFFFSQWTNTGPCWRHTWRGGRSTTTLCFCPWVLSWSWRPVNAWIYEYKYTDLFVTSLCFM